jgi:DNA-binding response OmpR family regulator
MESRRKVLLVEDDPILRNLIKEVLTADKYICHPVNDGREALETVNTETFDAVITDVKMPYIDGIRLTRELSKKYPDMPILIMTGFAHIHSDQEALAAGATDFIKKPFSITEFSARFSMMMHNHLTILKIRQELQTLLEDKDSSALQDKINELLQAIKA